MPVYHVENTIDTVLKDCEANVDYNIFAPIALAL